MELPGYLLNGTWQYVCSQEMKMKKLLLVASLVSVFAAANAMADVTASATASWDATATKDTTSLLSLIHI